MSTLSSAVDRFLDILGQWQSVDQLQEAASPVHACLSSASADELNAQLRRFLKGLSQGNLIEAGVAAIACGAMVEHGGDPDICGPVLLDRLGELLRDLSAFWDEIRRRSGVEPTPQNAMRLGERHFNEVLTANQAAAWAFYGCKPLVLGVVTHLSRSKSLRATARARPELLRLAPAADIAISEHSHLGCLLRVLDDEPLLVLHPGEGKGFRARMTGVADALQLDTLLAARLAGRLPVREPSPDIVSAVTDGPVRPDLETQGMFNLWTWGGLRPDGTLPERPGPESRQLLPWNTFPDQLPAFDGIRVVLLGKRNPPFSWPGTRRYREMPGALTVESELSPDEVRDWLARIGKADPTTLPAFEPPQEQAASRQQQPASQKDPNAELNAAQVAVREGRHAAAVEHLMHVVPVAPIHPAVLAVLDALVAGAPEPLRLVPTDRPLTFGTAAIHTYALGKAGRHSEAYQLLRQLAQANPACGIIDWALPWLEGEGLSVDDRTEAAFRFLVSAHQRFANQDRLNPDQSALVKRWLPHVRRLVEARPGEEQLLLAVCVLLRQAGEMGEAVAVARARHARSPSYESAVSLAANLRVARDFPAWEEASRAIFTFRPDDVPARLDMGDCYWDHQQKLEEAERWYADAVRLAPHHPWAEPSLLAVRYLRTRESRWRDELETYVDAHPQNDRARVAQARITPFFTWIAYPGDATLNIMNEVADKAEGAGGGEGEGVIHQVTTGLEAPSCRWSIDRQLALWGGKLHIERELRGLQSPDPRQPRVPVRYRLWEYDDLTPRPAVVPPPPAVVQNIAALASVPYDLAEWVGHASNLATRLGPASLEGLLAVMVHVPDPPAGVRMWHWTFRVQLAAALVISQMGRDWQGSPRQVLLDLVNGPMDWTTIAAVVSLTAVAMQNPNTAAEIDQLFDSVRRDLPRPGQEWYENAILNLHLRLPGLSVARRQELRAARAEAEARGGRRMSDAQMAARLFLARPIPEGWADMFLARNLIELFARGLKLDDPAFPQVLETCLGLVEASLPGAPDTAKAYAEEQLSVLRLIRAEISRT